MKSITTVKVGSSNEDIQGIYRKNDVENEIFDNDPHSLSDDEWLEWLCDKLFSDLNDDDFSLVHEFMVHPKTLELKLVSDSDIIRIVKC